MHNETHRCPRRDEVHPNRREDGGPDMWRDDRTCSYCGSLHPADFLKRLESGEEMGTATKNYKAYLQADPWGKFYFAHFNDGQRIKFCQLFNEGKLRTDFPMDPLPYFMKLRFTPQELQALE